MGILLFLTERRGPNVLVLITNCYRILTWRNTLTLSTLFNYQTNGNFGAAIIRPNTSPIFKSPSPKDRQDCGSRYLFNLSCTAMYYVMVHSMATTTAGTYNTYVYVQRIWKCGILKVHVHNCQYKTECEMRHISATSFSSSQNDSTKKSTSTAR